MGKHKWSTEETRLQMWYNHTIFDFITRMKTYGLGKLYICLICCTVFNRIDSHKAHKHHSGSTEHYIQAINDFKRRTEKILFAKNYFPKGKKHNLKDKLKKISMKMSMTM